MEYRCKRFSNEVPFELTHLGDFRDNFFIGKRCAVRKNMKMSFSYKVLPKGVFSIKVIEVTSTLRCEQPSLEWLQSNTTSHT